MNWAAGGAYVRFEVELFFNWSAVDAELELRSWDYASAGKVR